MLPMMINGKLSKKRLTRSIFIFLLSEIDIDVPYFSNIDILSGKNVNWTIVWFDSTKKDMMRQSLIDAGIDGDRIQLKPANEFYDL